MSDDNTKEVNLFNPHDGLTGRDGGPYLDLVERERAEEIRAKVEGRKPDFKNPAATAGTPLVTSNQLVVMSNPASNPSQGNSTPEADAIDELAANEDFPANAVSKAQMPDLSQAAEYDASNPTIKSVDEDSDDKPINVKQEEKGGAAKPNAKDESVLGK